MALIQCPECGGQISDKSKVCIHCGYPIEELKNESEQNNICIIDGKEVDLTEIIESLNKKEKDETGKYRAFKLLSEKTNLDEDARCDLIFYIGCNHKIPKEYNSKAKIYRKQVNVLSCPKCGSTAITTGARGANWTMGLFGASKTVNRCGACGYTWEPRK